MGIKTQQSLPPAAPGRPLPEIIIPGDVERAKPFMDRCCCFCCCVLLWSPHPPGVLSMLVVLLVGPRQGACNKL